MESVKGSNMKKNKTKTWEKTVRVDNITKRLCVEEILNGFLVTVSKYGDIKDDKGNYTYIDETTKYFSKSNPLDDVKDIPMMAKDTAKALGVDSLFDIE